MRTTFGQVRQSSVPRVLNLNPSDTTRVAAYVNEAQQRLLQKGKWWGTVQRIKICANKGCITWPRHVANTEAMLVNHSPVAMYDNWYEYLNDGPGVVDECCAGDDTPDTRFGTGCGSMLKSVYRGMACAFDDIIGEDKKIRIYCDNANDVGKTLLLQGYDENSNWILTDNGATNGERVTLAMPYVVTTKIFRMLTGVQKDVTLGNVRLYELSTINTQRALAIYEPDETLPWYRRSFIAGMTQPSTSASSNSCEKSLITAEVKLEFIPVTNDSDYMLIGNVSAIKAMSQAIKKENENLWDDAQKYEAKAVQILEEELAHYRGSGLKPIIKAESRSTYWGGGIESASGTIFGNYW